MIALAVLGVVAGLAVSHSLDRATIPTMPPSERSATSSTLASAPGTAVSSEFGGAGSPSASQPCVHDPLVTLSQVEALGITRAEIATAATPSTVEGAAALATIASACQAVEEGLSAR